MINITKYPKGDKAVGFWIFTTDFLDKTTYIEFYLIKIKITFIVQRRIKK